MPLLPPSQPATLPDPEAVPVPCEAPDCGATIPFRDAFRFRVALPGTGPAVLDGDGVPRRVAALMCPQEHQACSLAHALTVIHLCLEEHLAVAHAEAHAATAATLAARVTAVPPREGA